MPWLPQYGQGLQGWGQPPDLRAAPIGDLARAIMARDELRRKELMDIPKTIGQAIQEVQRNRVANALTKQYAEEGLIPQELAGQTGQTGLSAANIYMGAQKYRTYPTEVRFGEDQSMTLPLTRDQQVRVLMERARAARAQRYGGAEGGLPEGFYRDDQGVIRDAMGYAYRPGPAGRPVLMPGWGQRQVQEQRTKTRAEVAMEKAKASTIARLQRDWNLTDTDLLSEREYGTAAPDPMSKVGAGKNFTPTQPGLAEQPWVRIKTGGERGGGYVIMPRSVFETFHGSLYPGGQAPPAEPTPTPPPAGGGAQGGQGGQGVPMTSDEQAKLTWAYENPDDPLSEQIIARLKAEGKVM